MDTTILENPTTPEPENFITESEPIEQSSFQYPPLFANRTLLELCNYNCESNHRRQTQNYLRGCKWSPDGTCCLSIINNLGVHVTELPQNLYMGDVSAKRPIDILDSVIHIKEAGLVYDFCWYPKMNSNLPESCCWVTTRQNAPIQMWDAFDGSLRCSYRGFNAVDEMEPALAVTFSENGERIVAGYKKFLRTFDINRPGREFTEHKISSPASCLAIHDNLMVVGSWNTSISLYNINEMGTYKSIGKMHGHSGGVTHMKFTPDGQRLVSGARKDHRLIVWDIRYYRRPLNILHRVVKTNQRIYFDISPCGKYLVSGSTDGIVRVWNEEYTKWQCSIDGMAMDIDNAILKFPVHKDCCNSVSIHPCRPILATGSGQYHMSDPSKSIDNEEFSPTRNENKMENYSNECDLTEIDTKYADESENSLVFWWIGDVTNV